MDDLIDIIEGNRRYIKCLYVYNKVCGGAAGTKRVLQGPLAMGAWEEEAEGQQAGD